MSHYAPLFTFVIDHDFYDDGVVHGLSFKPCEDTARVMSNAGLMVKAIAGGIAVLFDEAKKESLQLYIEDDEPLDLVFKVYPGDASFGSRSDISIDSREKILYVNNHEHNSEAGERIKLHDDSYVSMIDAIRLDSDQLAGVLGRREKFSPPFLVVSIRIVKDDLSRIDNPDVSPVKNYYIRLKARQVFWKYYLVGAFAREGLFLSDVDGLAEFVSMGKEELAGHRKAIVFRSAQKLSLKASFDYRFQLKEKDSNGDKVIIKRLPMAEVTRFGRDVIDGSSEVVSEIYINC
jgi:hypothetical protein